MQDKKVPMVFRHVRVPKVFWDHEVAPLLLRWKLECPTEDFNVYRWMLIEKFLDEASPAFFTKLLGLSLQKAGLEINLINNMPILTYTTAEDENEYNKTDSIIRVIASHRDSLKDYEKTKLILEKYPPSNKTQIVDVAIAATINEQSNTSTQDVL